MREAQRVDLADLAASACRALTAEAHRGDVTLIICLEPAAVLGNATLLDRLVTNLVTNAVRHNHTGGTVQVHTASVPGHSLLSIENTGTVIRADQVDGLFEPFRRHRDRVSRAPAGSGLGLSIVRAVAHAHQATVAASARPGGGLLVTVTWPD
jgi:signal transduction histidine kinase